MNFRYMIYEVKPRAYVLLRQNIHSEIWSCEEARGRTARDTAELAYRNELTPVYTTMVQASEAAFLIFPHLREGTDLTLGSSLSPITGKIRPTDSGGKAFLLVIDTDRPSRQGQEARFSKLRF